MDWLVDGWQQRTEQKLALAGCMAALLSLRSDPLRTSSRLRDFAQKLVGYGGAAVIFSGIQETCRAARGRHDFLNSAVSGAVTGALVVGHYQGPQYRLLGVVTWGSLGAVLHLANSVLQPRYYVEDYLIREGLLSPEATRFRQAPAQRPSSGEVGLLFPEYEHRDILLEAKAIRDRDLRLINEGASSSLSPSKAPALRPVAASPSVASAAGQATTAAVATAGFIVVDDIADDDPGYQVWLRTSGYQADALLQSPQQRQQPLEQPQLADVATPGGVASGREEEGGSERSGEASHADSAGSDGAAAPAPEAKARSWSVWLTPWIWQFGKGLRGAADSEEQRRRK